MLDNNCIQTFVFPGMLGQQLFMAKLGYCNDSLVFQRELCVGAMKDVGLPRIWVNPENNFGILVLSIYAQVIPLIPPPDYSPIAHRLGWTVPFHLLPSCNNRFMV
jgi:hypothetical protein